MAATITVREVWSDGRRIHMLGSIAVTGNYVAGGEALDFKALTQWKSSKDPDFVEINGKSGFIYTWDRVAKKMMTFVNVAGGVNNALGEHTAVAYVAGILADTIDFYAIGKKLI